MPTPVIMLTPSRMAVAERQLAALAVCGLAADSVMAAFRAVTSFVHGSAQTEIALRDYRDATAGPAVTRPARHSPPRCAT
ncbi:TetR/AcrR family transcriptional regulator C-terminal domain-containing protein [Streptomyces sp. NPDC006265]|uniref:TetR/AcrR family transcriptional regulator C-terminal domain-containing protein n=1 Tax=Streptomyces sp. NPDC006265 TaxID=3156740 RepID=UPI0033AC1500